MPNGLLSTFFLSPHRLCLSLVICSLRVLHFVAKSFLYVLLIFRLFSFFLVIRVFLIDCVKEGEEEALGRLEGFWQNNLATFEENGAINRRDEMTVRRN